MRSPRCRRGCSGTSFAEAESTDSWDMASSFSDRHGMKSSWLLFHLGFPESVYGPEQACTLTLEPGTSQADAGKVQQ